MNYNIVGNIAEQYTSMGPGASVVSVALAVFGLVCM